MFDRKEIVAALWERIEHTRVVYIRGTPASKSPIVRSVSSVRSSPPLHQL